VAVNFFAWGELVPLRPFHAFDFSLQGAMSNALGGRFAPAYFPIAYKLALVFTLLSTIGMVGLGYLIAREQNSLLELQTSDFGFTVASQMGESSEELLLADDSLGLEVITNNLITHERIKGTAIYNEEGTKVVGAGAVPTDQLVPEDIGEGLTLHWRDTQAVSEVPGMMSFVSPVVFRDVRVGYALVTFDRSLLVDAQRRTVHAVAGATVVLVLLGVMVSIMLGKRLTRPIHQLMDASRAISAGNYNIRFSERRNDELGALMEAMNTMSEGLLHKEQVELAFSRYLSPNIARQVLDDVQQVKLGGQRVIGSVLFADIVGFTSISEGMSPEAVSGLLNDYFSLIAEAANRHNGHVDKYMGDCAMLVFGVPETDENRDNCFDAIACAVLIHRVVDSLNDQRRRRGLVTIQFRIGVNSGNMLAGNMGSSERMEYTVVGDSVNLASRLASAAGPGEVIIGEDLNTGLREAGRIVSETQGTIRLRGKKEPVTIYRVIDVTGEQARLLERQRKEILAGLPLAEVG
jgi:adenylate cyclase